MELPMQTLNNLSRSLIALEPASTLIAVIEMSLSSWLVAGIVPGIERQPLKKLADDRPVRKTCSRPGASSQSDQSWIAP
jgi:transposase